MSGLPTAHGKDRGDTGYNSAADEASILTDTGVRVIPVRRKNMQPHAWFVDELELREYRHTIATVNRQAEAMGIERVHARTNAGFELKVHASLVALQCWNAAEWPTTSNHDTVYALGRFMP